MSKTTTGCLRRLDARLALAALAVAAIAAAPVVAFTDAVHPTKTTVSADPNDDWYYIPDGGAGGGGSG